MITAKHYKGRKEISLFSQKVANNSNKFNTNLD